MFVDLACSTLQKIDERRLDISASSMCLLKGQLYIGTETNGLQVFDENLKQIGDIQLAQLGCIYGLTPLLHETLVVAANSGLFHINQQGRKWRINEFYKIIHAKVYSHLQIENSLLNDKCT